MREKMLTNSASQMSLLVIIFLLRAISPFLFSSVQNADAAAPPTAISPTPQEAGGLHTIVTPSSAPANLCSGNCVITGGTRPSGGTNLFHSFGQFNIGAGDVATFQNGISFDLNGAALQAGLPTSNILARVTGGNLSSIYGTIQTSGFGNANLFLMNPTGFLFGPNATVNVGGMMTFTTADYLRLSEPNGSNAGIFHADAARASVLTSAPVSAFGFIGSNPAAITFEGGQLTVAGGTGVTLVGGDNNLIPDASGTPSGITAHGRSIQMTSVAGPGEVTADTLIPAAGMALGKITLGPGAMIDASGDPSFGDGSGSGGAISIRAGQLIATEATITTNPAIGSAGKGGDVTIAATDTATFSDSKIVTGGDPIAFSFAGSAGSVSVTADEGLTMTRTTVDASAFFAGGDAGSVTLNSLNGPVSLTDSTILTNASAPGNGGAVMIKGKDVTLTRSRIDSTVDSGFFDFTIDDPALGLVRPGAVNVTAQNTVTFSGSFANSPTVPVIRAKVQGTLFDASPVTITGKTVNLDNGMIDTGVEPPPGGQGAPSTANGGSIEIHGNNVNLSQFTITSENAAASASTAIGGSILFRGADQLLADNIQLTNTSVSATSLTAGGGGHIEFQTKALTLNDTQVRADTFGIGPGGSVVVRGAQTVTLQSNSIMDTSAVVSGPGNDGPFGTAGSILLETQQLTMKGGSSLRAADLPTSQGNAGSITVQGTNGPAQSILIDGAGTGIFTDAEGNGAGGDINLFANSVSLQNGGTLSATTSGTVPTATGGTITVEAANTVGLASGASISASSTGVADAGSINITAMNGFTMQNSTVKTQAEQGGGGGNIKVTTSPDATVLLQDSLISASVADGHGGGGNISIDPQFVILQNSQILARAAQGQGGAITIIAGLFLQDASSIVNADSGSGVNGTVTIQSPNAPISGQIQPLGKTPLLATSLLNQRCASLAGGEFSSFTVAGRDSLPTEPGGWLTSPLALTISESGSGTLTQAGTRASLNEPTEEAPLLSLRQIAPAGFLTQAFAVDRSAGCHS